VSKVRISGGLFACLLGVYLPIAQTLFLPAPMIKAAGQEAWLALIIAGIVGTLLAGLPSVWVGMRHPGLGVAQISRRLLGRWAGGPVSLFYSALLVYIFGLCIRDIIDFSHLVLLPGTPGVVIAILFAGISLYGAWHGLEPTVRVAFQALVFMVLTAFLVPMLQLREISIKNVDPFLYRGIGSVFQAAFVALPWFTEIVSILGLMQHLKHPQKAHRWLLAGGVASILPISFLTLHMTLALGSDLPARFLYPTYYLMQLISIAKILERIEVVIVTVFLTGMFIKSALYLFLAAETTAQTFGLRHHHWPAVGLTALAVVIAHMWGGILNLLSWEAGSISVWVRLSIEVGLPALLLTASFIRQAGAGQRGSAHA